MAKLRAAQRDLQNTILPTSSMASFAVIDTGALMIDFFVKLIELLLKILIVWESSPSACNRSLRADDILHLCQFRQALQQLAAN
ncbi:MAG: hypothetical protein R2851_15510 [Caldilineaceae bacterium]